MAAVLIIAAVLAALLWPRSWLVIQEGKALRYAFPTTSGSDFVLRWTHSVEKEDWEERFQIQTDGSLMLVETRFKTFGAGVPAAVGSETRLEQGWVVMSGIHRPVDPLHVQAAEAEHYRLCFQGRTLDLTHPGVPPILTFTTREAPLLTMLPARFGTWWRQWRSP
ncbi:DUF1850 domain-containing protein [Alloalcanivorax xenomutans]|uniref:DUF1850 domain-containing protein n=1 Tax=Alloalcanivorax balearicus MACL04 TaxID=1177182 RepID=A0ABT2QWF1_9GAMM|nr:DUF1850 domain-containing protein [Alloalcanivorax xenomutans]ARB46788.1 hypothetical protein P40_16345 [Alloalcanivorax xenomutans]MCU5781845.1 hypothetical protein [Alloalcanivorax balearicus MACL04]